MFSPQRLNRALSAFDHAGRRWAAVPLRPLAAAESSSSSWAADRRIVGEQLTLTSWNIQAVQHKRAERARRILDSILDAHKPSDIIFLQEVASDVRQSVLDDPRVRARFLASDAEDDTAFTRVPAFATMTLLSKERFAGNGERGAKILLDSVFRMDLPSRDGKDALCIGIRAPARPGKVLRLLNAQLDSRESSSRRELQVSALAGILREPGCGGGVIAGEFIAPALVERLGLVDAWVKHTVEGNDERPPRPHRLDKVVMSGLEPVALEVLQPGRIDAGLPWSDRCGLRCTFTI